MPVVEQMGNRAFLRWVGELQAAGRKREAHEAAVHGSQAPGRPQTRLAPLQLMPKKKKKKGESAGAEVADTLPVATPETAAATVPEPQAAVPQAEPGVAATPGEKKKKKKPRVQVALNVLRVEGVEGVEEFGRYIHAEISEPALLQTLTERINRAQGLGSKKDPALRTVESRIRELDLESADAPQAAAPGQVQVTEKTVVAPIKTVLNRREKELFVCCFKGNASRTKYLLRFGNIDINMAIEEGTFLCIATYHGHAAVVRELLSIPGIDVNLAHQTGVPPLYYAAQQGYVEIVRLLLAQRYIKPNLGTLNGMAPLHIATQKGHEPVIRLFLANPNLNVNVRKPNGATPLLVAAQNNFPGIVELLIKRGANVNLGLSEEGSVPLIVAAIKNHVGVIRPLLQEPSIKVNQVTKDGVTALCAASQEGHKKVVNLLLEKGADPNILTDTGTGPLLLACLYRHTAVFEMLLNAGADTEPEIRVPGGEKITIYRLAQLIGHQRFMTLLEKRQRDKPAQTAQVERLSPCLRPQGQALEEEPDWSTPPTTPPPEWSTPPTTPPPEWSMTSLPMPVASLQPVTTVPAPPAPVVADSQPAAAKTQSPLAMANYALIQEVLKKLDNETLEPLKGIRLLEDVNATNDIDKLTSLYNRLASIERQRERARRHRPVRHEVEAAGAQVRTPDFASPRYALGNRVNLDVDAVEGEIRKYLDQSRHRFISQAVNDMEFGRGKPTSGYPGLLHASAGIPGVGGCTVFYYTDVARQLIRIVGIGHHLDAASYQLDYAAGELGGRGRTLRLS